METEEFLAITRIERGVRPLIEQDCFDRAWALGAEVLSYAILTQDESILRNFSQYGLHAQSKVDSEYDKGHKKEINSYLVPGKRIHVGIFGLDSFNIDKVDELSNEVVEEIVTIQANGISKFYKDGFLLDSGEDMLSFNKRILKQKLSPTLIAFGSDFVKYKHEDGAISFSLDGRELSSVNYDDEAMVASLDNLHTSLFKLDSLCALYCLLIDQDLPYTPVLTGPLFQSHAYSDDGQNITSDILLIGLDGEEVIPVKVHSQPSNESDTSDIIVSITNKHIYGINFENDIRQNSKGHMATSTRIGYHSGLYTRKIAHKLHKISKWKRIDQIGVSSVQINQLINLFLNNDKHKNF